MSEAKFSRLFALFLAVGILITLPLGTVASAEDSLLASQSSVEQDESSIIEEMSDIIINKSINSNRFTSPEPYTAHIENHLTLDGFRKLMENENLELWYRDEINGIRVVNKHTGKIWGGLTQDQPDNMNKSWSAVGNSLVAFDYYDTTGPEKRTGTGHADCTTTYTQNGNVLIFHAEYTPLGISFDFEVELTEDGLTFRFDHNSVVETDTYTMAAIYFVPFMGTTQGNEIEGYMFVPDGCGALIRFSAASRYLKGFDQRIYGLDYGIDSTQVLNDLNSIRPNNYLTESPNVTLPVFGMVHGVNQNAYYAEITEGDEWASIMATPAGVSTDYNWMTSKFVLRQKYQQPTSKSGAGLQVVQKQRNPVVAQIEYHFLDGEEADYVGIAKQYRNDLVERGVLTKQETIRTDIPLKADFICADIEKGFLFNRTKTITPLSYVKEVVSELQEEGISDLNISLLGWQKGGISGKRKTKISFAPQTGTREEVQELNELITSKGGTFSLMNDPLTAKENQLDIRATASVSISQSPIVVTQENVKEFLMDTYFLEPEYVLEIMQTLNEIAVENGMTALSFTEVSTYLLSTHLKDQVVTRNVVKAMYEECFAAMDESLDYIGLETPNRYLWQYTDGYYETPMVNSQYLYESDSVPFLQIVLKGYIDLYAPYSNVDFFTELDILKHIDYGTYPSYLLTELENHELEKTTVFDYTSTNYTNWAGTIPQTYQTINEILKHVEGATMESRKMVRQGVSVTEYSNGSTIIVNYLADDVSVNGVLVPGVSAIHIEG